MKKTGRTAGGKIRGKRTFMRDRIQTVRGIAIIAVVLIHTAPEGLAQVWCRPWINFPVGVFLFLSGMLSDAARWHPKKRIIKVLIPYCIWTLIFVAAASYGNYAQIPVLYIKNLLTADSASPMYFVPVYCECTLLIPLIDKLARSKYRWIGFVISPLEIVMIRLLPLVMGYEINPYISIIKDISCLGWFTYFYLGYLLGNGLLEIKASTLRLGVMWLGAVVLQTAEGYWYYTMGKHNCGTQLKLSAVLTGVLVSLLACRYICSEKLPSVRFLKVLGDKSFGIFFTHIVVLRVLGMIPYYSTVAVFPVNALITVAVSLLCVLIGGKVLGRYAKYFAL